MFGYAVDETTALMPAPIHFSHQILKNMAEDRRAGKTPQLGPDSKSQVTLEYVDGKPVRANTVVVSTQHSEQVSLEEVREKLEISPPRVGHPAATTEGMLIPTDV